jgi:type I restriction enzyme S subunit
MSLNLDRSSWKRVVFGDVAKASKEKCDPADGSIQRYVAGEHMDTDDLKVRRWGDVGDGYLGPAFHRAFHPGQVLYGSRRTYLRKVAVAEFDGVCANTTFVLETKDSDLLIQEYLPFIMTSERFHDFSMGESKGSVNPYVNWSDIARYEFDLPPIDEQRRIADLLWAAESERESQIRVEQSQASLIRDYCEFMYRRWHSEFDPMPLTSAGELRMGRQKAPKFMTGNHTRPFLRVANIGDLELDLSIVEEMDFDASEFVKYQLRSGDILLTEGDIVSPLNVGRPALYSDEIRNCCFQNTLIRFRPHPDTNPQFALVLFEGMRLAGVFARGASTTTVTHLGLGRLSAIDIPHVPAEVQNAVAFALDHLLDGRKAVRDSGYAALNLRKSLLKAIVG